MLLNPSVGLPFTAIGTPVFQQHVHAVGKDTQCGIPRDVDWATVDVQLLSSSYWSKAVFTVSNDWRIHPKHFELKEETSAQVLIWALHILDQTWPWAME